MNSEEFAGKLVHEPKPYAQLIAVNALLVVCGLFFILPMLWMVLAAVDAEATQQLKLPVLTLHQFAIAMSEARLHALLNSLIVLVIATVVANQKCLRLSPPIHSPGTTGLWGNR